MDIVGLETSRWAAAAALLFTGCVTSAEVGGKPQDDAGGTGSDSTGEPVEPSTTGDDDDATTTTDADTEDDTTTGGEPIAPGRCVRETGRANEWVFHCGSLAHENLVGAGVDADGNVYAAIDWRATDEVFPSSLEIGDETLDNGGLSDTLLVKLDTDGAVVWTRHFGGVDDQHVGEFAVCADRIVVSGEADVGTIDLGGGVLPHRNYLAAFDHDGQHLWSRSFEVPQDEYLIVLDVACDDDGNVFFSGGFDTSVDLGGGTIAGGEQASFLAKLDTSGALVWARGGEGDYIGGYGKIALAPGGDILVAGNFSMDIDLGAGPITGDEDAFVARYDPDGEYVWGVQIGPEGSQGTNGVVVAPDGTIAVTGSFVESVEIGDETFENVVPDQIPGKEDTTHDAYVATLDPSGAWSWARHEGTTSNDGVYGHAFTEDGELLATAWSDDGLRLDSYVGQERTTLRALSETSWLHTTLVPTNGDRVMIAAVVTQKGDLTFADVPLVGQGWADAVIAKLAK